MKLKGCCGGCQIVDYYLDLIIDNVVQQGASLYTVQGLTQRLGNATLFLLNGDIRWALPLKPKTLTQSPLP